MSESKKDIWAEARERTEPTYRDGERTYYLPSIPEMYNSAYTQGRQAYSRVEGKISGNLASRRDINISTRDNLEKKLYNSLHADPELEMDYDSIQTYLDSHPDVVNDINKAFSSNLNAMGRPQNEIQEALADLTGPWRVNYVYSLLTTNTPNYTVSPGVSRETVQSAIDSETQVKGGKRRRKSRKFRKSKKNRRTKKRRRTRKY